MTNEQIVKRVVLAALDFRQQDQRVRMWRQLVKPCTARELGEPGVGLMDSGPCDTADPGAERCENCQARYYARPDYKESLRKRHQAKQQLLRWVSKIPVEGIDSGAPAEAKKL